MPSIPLPFVISLLLCLILVRTARRAEHKFGLFPLLIAAFAVQAALSGLNWNVGWHPARLIQPVLAAALPALAFCAFGQLSRLSPVRAADIFLHLGPAYLVASLIAFWRAPVDIVLFATYFGYGVALLTIARRGPDALSSVRITDGWTAYKALVAVAALLVATSLIDAVISLEFAFGHGEQGRDVLAIASVLWLAIAGYASTVADDTRPEVEDTAAPVALAAPSPPRVPGSADDLAIAGIIDALLREQHLYRDPDLTLERLARRAGVPGRQVSGAVNRVHSRNVSQLVNEYRINDAKQRLITTRDPVTTIMLDSGFGTKSNFNREFLRVIGMTPSDYRRNGDETSTAPELPAEASFR